MARDDRDYDYEIFSPAYLNEPESRPQNPVWMDTVPTLDPDFDAYVLEYGSGYTLQIDGLPLGQTLTKAVLMVPGSVTHHSDMHQRYVELVADVSGGETIEFRTPTAETQAPPGLYMLFLITNAPSVSHAIWVMLP